MARDLDILPAMITKDQILTAGTTALAKAFQKWLDENREAVLQTIATVANSASQKPTKEAPAKSTDGPFLTVGEVAARWHCCIQTVHRRLKAGQLPRLMMNRRHILIPLEAVLKLEKDATYAES